MFFLPFFFSTAGQRTSLLDRVARDGVHQIAQGDAWLHFAFLKRTSTDSGISSGITRSRRQRN